MAETYDPQEHRTLVAAAGGQTWKFFSVNKLLCDMADAGIVGLTKAYEEPGGTGNIWLDLSDPEVEGGTPKAWDGVGWTTLTPQLFYEHIAGEASGYVTNSEMELYVAAHVTGRLGIDIQAYDAALQSLSALGTAADKIAYTTGLDTWAETPLTAFARTLLDDADAATMRATLGAGVGNGDAITTNPLSQFAPTTSAELAGVLSDETGTGVFVRNTSPGFDVAANPATDDGASLGTSALKWADLFLASGSVVNFNAGDVTITHAANKLTFSGASLGYEFSANVVPTTVGLNLGAQGTKEWSALALVSGGGITFSTDQSIVANGVTSLAFSGAATYTFGGHITATGKNLTCANVLVEGGGAIKFNTTDVLITHGLNQLSFTGASNGYTFDVPIDLASGGTGASLTDPGADRVMFWDDSAGQVTWLTIGTGLAITGTTLDSTSSGGDALTSNPLSQFASTTSAQLAGVLSDETGSGGKAMFSAGPTLDAGTTSIPAMAFTSGSNLTTAAAGSWEFDGVAPMFTPLGTQRGIVPAKQFFRLNAGLAGSNATGAQNIFGKSVTVTGSTIYAFRLMVNLYKTAGTTSHTITYSIGGTATINNLQWGGIITSNASAFPTALTQVGMFTTANLNPSGAITAASWNSTAQLQGTISVNAGGTLNWNYALSAAPGGAYTTVAGAWVEIWPIGASGANVSVGTWA